MSCLKLRGDLALYVGGDLPASRVAQLEAHVRHCDGCRESLEQLRSAEELLGGMRLEPLDEAIVARMRTRVLERVAAEQTRTVRRHWKWALAAALIVAAIAPLRWKDVKRQPASRLNLSPAAQTVSTVTSPAPVRPAAARRHRRAFPRRTAARTTAAPLLVQFVTDDPNIVIYWLVDRTPEGD